MAKFNAGTAVEKLEYDFTEYGAGQGIIPEPTTATINGFFANVKAIVADTKAFRNLMEKKDGEDITDAEAAALMDQMEDAADFTAKMQERMLEAVAILCGAEYVEETDTFVGGSPSLDDLKKLPYRVAQAFNQWLMGEIRPKSTAPGTRR